MSLLAPAIRRGHWIDLPVHPVSPEDGYHGIRSHHTVKQREHDEEEWHDVRNDSERGCKGTNPLTPASLEEEEEHGLRDLLVMNRVQVVLIELAMRKT